MNIEEIIGKHREWTGYNFPFAEKWEPLAGIMEEIGELGHALRYHHPMEKVDDAIGDIQMYLWHFVSLNQIQPLSHSGARIQQSIDKTKVANPSGAVMMKFASIVDLAGQLAHSFLKRHQGIRNNEDHDRRIESAYQCLQSVIWSFCESIQVDWVQCVNDTWDIISKRDWQKEKKQPPFRIEEGAIFQNHPNTSIPGITDEEYKDGLVTADKMRPGKLFVEKKEISGKQFITGIGISEVKPEDDYDLLMDVFGRAINQASKGKGKERHAKEGMRFEDQPICEIGRKYGYGFNLGQAEKKMQESLGLSPERAVFELLGAMNYIASAIMLIEEGKFYAYSKEKNGSPIGSVLGDK
jgi:hypothetical protein